MQRYKRITKGIYLIQSALKRDSSKQLLVLSHIAHGATLSRGRGRKEAATLRAGEERRDATRRTHILSLLFFSRATCVRIGPRPMLRRFCKERRERARGEKGDEQRGELAEGGRQNRDDPGIESERVYRLVLRVPCRCTFGPALVRRERRRRKEGKNGIHTQMYTGCFRR